MSVQRSLGVVKEKVHDVEAAAAMVVRHPSQRSD
jgi:hypothetical protein